MRYAIIIVFLFIFNPFFSQDRIRMRYENEIYTLPCKVNGLELRFILDTGAARVSISPTEAWFMLKNGYLSESDVGGRTQSILADGSIAENAEIILRRIEIGGKVLTNVKALVKLNNLNAPLLLGQSALQQLGGYCIEFTSDGCFLTIGNQTVTRTTLEKNKASTTYVATGNVNLRIGPSTNSEIILEIPKNDFMKEVDSSNKDWIEVNYKGKGGYAHKSLLKSIDDFPVFRTVSNTNLRVAANTSSDVIDIIPASSDVRVIDKVNKEWWIVYYSPNKGYVYSSLLQAVSSSNLSKSK